MNPRRDILSHRKPKFSKMAHEQNLINEQLNAIVKGNGAVSGITENEEA